MIRSSLFLLGLASILGCATYPVVATVDSSTTKVIAQTENHNKRTPTSTFANEGYYNKGFDRAVLSQFNTSTKLCRCNDIVLKNRVGILDLKETAANPNSTMEYRLECGVRTSSDRSGQDEVITAVSCKSFDPL